jgi:hypothetical protein
MDLSCYILWGGIIDTLDIVPTPGLKLDLFQSCMQVAILRGHPIFQVTGTHVFANEEMHVDDSRCPLLFRGAHFSSAYPESCKIMDRIR